MAEQVARIKLQAIVEGLEGFDQLKGAFKGLQQAIGPTDAQITKARKDILEFGKAAAQSESTIRGQIDALKALQSQATIGSTVYRQLKKDVSDLGGAYKEAASGVKQFTDAQLKSQIVGSKPGTFDKQIAALRRDLQDLSVYSDQYTQKLTEIQRRQLPFNAALGRQNVIAGFEAYAQGGKGGSALPALPDTTAGLNQRLSELNAEFVHLTRGGTDWIRVSREIAAVQRQLNQEFANPAVEAARRRLEASRNTSSGFLAFSQGLDDRIAIEKSIARNQRKVDARSPILAPEAPMREISALYQSIGSVGMSRISGDIDRMGKSYTEVAQDIRAATAASDGSINSLRAQRNSWEALRNTLGNNKAALREVNKEIAAVDRQLEKRGVGGGGIGPKAQAFGAIASGAIFGGVEGAIGGLAGAAIGGVPGAFAGAAFGGSISMIRQNVVAMGEFSAQVAKLEIALRGVAGSAQEFAAAQQVIRLAQIELNVPVMEATQGFTQLTAAVKGAGGNVADAEVVFRGVTEAIKATGGGAEEVQGALTAMAQIFSKGKVSAEELQGQLGERLPGAVTLFAQATGRTLPQLQKDLEQGVVGLNDVMKFAASLSGKYGEQAITMAASTEDSTARMKVALDDLRRAFGSIVQPITASVQSVITKLAEMAVRALKAVGLVKDSMAELGAAGRAKDLQTRTVDAYRALGTGPQSFSEKKQAYDLARELANAATPQKSLVGVQQNIRALQQAQQIVRQITSEGLNDRQRNILVEYGANLDKRIAREQKLLKILQDQRKLTQFQQPDRTGKSDKDKTQEKLADLEIKNELSFFDARQQYEERIAEIRKNAIEQIQQLERQFGDERLKAERDVARTRREIEAAQSENQFTRQIQLGADPGLIDAQRGIDQILRKAEEDRIKIEEEYSDKELQRTRTIADFQKGVADQINKANQDYAKQIGKIQRDYALNSAKIVEGGGINAGKALEKSSQIAALYSARGAINSRIAQSIGTVVAEPGRSGSGSRGIEDLIAQYGAATEFGAIQDIDRQIRQLQSQVRRAAAPPAPVISSPRRIPVSQQFDLPGSAAVAAANAEQRQVRLQQVDVTVIEEVEKRFLAISEESTRQVQTLRDQNELVALQAKYLHNGVTPELAQQLAQTEQLYEKQKRNLASERDAAVKRGLDAATVNDYYKEQLAIVERQYGITVKLTEELAKQQELLRFRQDTNIGAGLREGAQQYVESIGTMREATAQLAQTGIKGVEDAIFSLVTTGTANFREFAASILKDTARMIIQQMILRVIMQAIGAIPGGGGGGGGGGVLANFNAAAATYNANGNAFGKNGIMPFAMGGIIDKPTLFKFANGGAGQLGLMGEAGPEAIIPLRRGRDGKLGVAGGGSSTNVTVNVDASGSSVQGNSGQGEQLGRAISQAVQAELIKQRRPGGLLAA